MKYTITYRNPNNIVRTGWRTETHSSVGPINRLLEDERRYPGSCEIQSIVKETKKGREVIR